MMVAIVASIQVFNSKFVLYLSLRNSPSSTFVAH